MKEPIRTGILASWISCLLAPSPPRHRDSADSSEKCIAKSDLLTGIESHVVPRHTHGWFWFLIAAEKLEESSTTPVDLPVRRLNVDGILGEAADSLRRIALVPTIGDPLEKLPELFFRNVRVDLIAACHNQT